MQHFDISFAVLMFYKTAMCMHWREEMQLDLFTISRWNKIPETMFHSITQKILKKLEFVLLHFHLHNVLIYCWHLHKPTHSVFSSLRELHPVQEPQLTIKILFAGCLIVFSKSFASSSFCLSVLFFFYYTVNHFS